MPFMTMRYQCIVEIVRLFGACRRPCNCRTVADNWTESYNLYLGWKGSGGRPRVSWYDSNINTERSRFDPVADYANYCSTTHRVSAHDSFNIGSGEWVPGANR